MPDIKYTKKEDIPEGLREFAKEADGGFIVAVVPKSKLDEFRDNNLTIARERDELKNKVIAYAEMVGDDPVKARETVATLKAIDQQVKDGKLKGSEAIEAEVNRRVAETKSNFENQLAQAGARLTEATAKAGDFENKFKRSTVDREITNAVLHPESGINPAALPDVLTRAYGFYTVQEDGRLVAKQGDNVVYGADGVTPMPPKEWLSKVLEQAPYLGKQSAGGGASGASGKTSYGGLSQTDFDKLPAVDRLTLARTAAGKAA